MTKDPYACRKCGGELIRCRHKDGWLPKDKQLYYFKLWDRCVNCGALYMLEEYKRLTSEIIKPQVLLNKVVKLMPTIDVLASLPKYVMEVGYQELYKRKKALEAPKKRPSKRKKGKKFDKLVLSMSAKHSKYLRSKKWKKRRDKYRRTKMYLRGCAGCKVKENLNVHHRHYETVGKERDIDLLPLCNKCHDKVHGAPNRTTNKEKMALNEIRMGIFL